MTGDLGLWGVPVAILGGAIRVSTPLLFVSLGEVLTERSGRIDLGLEGTLVFGAMSAYAVVVMTGSAWAGVLTGAVARAGFGLVHGLICSAPQVNDIAIGIALMLLGTGLAFFFGKAVVQPVAPRLPAIPLGWWSDVPRLRAALEVSLLFVVGALLAGAMAWMLRATRLGLTLGVVGDSSDAARAWHLARPGARPRHGGGGRAGGDRRRPPVAAIPGKLERGHLLGPGPDRRCARHLRAVEHCLFAALLFGGAGALGPALQSVGVSSGHDLSYAAPYVLILVVLIASSSRTGALTGVARALSIIK